MTLNVQNAKEIDILQSKNMFNKNATPDYYARCSVESTATGVKLTATETASSGAFVTYIIGKASKYAGKTVTLSATYSSSSGATPRMYIGRCSANAQSRESKAWLDNTGSISWTVSDSQTYPYLCVSVYANATNSTTAGEYSEYSNVQLEVGSMATAYEPYVAPQDVKTIHDKDKKLIWGRLEYDTKYEGDAWQQTYTGKNLMPYNTYNSNDGRIMYMPNLKLGTSTFTISFDLDSFTLGTAQNVRLFIQLQDSSGNFVNNQNAPILTIVSGTSLGRYSYTFTTTGDTNNASTNLRADNTSFNAGGRVTISNIQIEAGSTATPYEPYVGGVPAPNPNYPQDIKVVEGPQTIMLRGKNKFSFNAGDAATGGDVSQTHTDSSVHMVATGTIGAQYYRVSLGNFNPEKRYWVSCKGKKIVKGTDGGPRLRLSVYYSDNGTSWTALQSAQENYPVQGQTYNLSASFIGHQYYRFYFYNNGGTPVTVGEETEYWDIQVVEHPVSMGALSQISIADSHGIKYWNTNDGRIIANGTSDAISQVAFTGFYTYVKGRTYSIKFGNPVAAPSNSGTQIKFLDADQNQPYIAPITDAYGTYTFTATETKDLRLAFRTNSGVTLNNFEIKPVVYDTTDEPFEAYQAKTVSMDLRGVNLMPMDSAIIDNDARTRRFKMGLPAGTYTVSYDLESFEMGTNTSFGINFGLAAAGSGYVLDLSTQTLTSNTALGRYSKTFTITAPVSIDRQSDVRVANTWWTNGARVSISNIQIEVGATDTTYQTYHDPYWLARISTFKDYLYKDGDDWKFHHEIIKKKFDGSTEGNWGMYSSGMAFYLDTSDLYKATSSWAPETACVYSDYYKSYLYTYVVATTPVVDYGISLYGATTPRSRLNVRNKDCADVTAFTNWLSTHNLTVYAARETASDVVITDAALIEKLNSIHDWLNRYGYHADVVGDLPIVINQESL